MKNIACNLIYNNGDEYPFVGFNGVCSVQNIKYNVEKGTGRWCSQPECSCRKFYDNAFKGKVDEFPCNESRLFHEWTWNPGGVFKTGELFRILNSGVGKYAILTTCFSNTKEKDRKIIGFFKIKEIKDDFHNVIAFKNKSLRLPLDEAKGLNFWNYHRNVKSTVPVWKQGRFRYLEDKQVAAILQDLSSVVQNETDQSLILQLFKSDFPEFSDVKLSVIGALSDNNVKNIRLLRKYGKGGESKEHKELKQYIANHPEKIGLDKKTVKPNIEHPYISGDQVDILFESMDGNTDTVVEIELDNVLPGIHQAIKYRALRCAQRGLSLNDKRVKATVVAWCFTDSEIALCKKYDIDFYKMKL